VQQWSLAKSSTVGKLKCSPRLPGGYTGRFVLAVDHDVPDQKYELALDSDAIAGP